MSMSRREFLKASVASAVAANGLAWFGAGEVFGADTVVIPSASHWGPFKAVVKKGVLVGIQPLADIDAMPTKMLTEGLISRVYHKTRVMYPMVRKSYLANPTGDTKPHLRGKEPFVRVTWDEILAITANAILTTAEQHGNEALFSSSYGGWSHAGLLRPQVLQGRLFGLIGGHSVTTGDYSGGASQISLPHVIGDMEVYSPQTAWEVMAEHTEVMVWIGCDPWKNNRIEYTVADHQMFPRWKLIKDELRNAAAMLRYACERGRRRLREDRLPDPDHATMSAIVREHRRLWMARNCAGGLDRSVSRLTGAESSTF